MANTYTTNDIFENVKLLSHMPEGNATFTEANVITLADRELQTALIKQILSVREGYYLTYEDFDVNSTGEYAIPSKAIGGALYNIEILQNSTVIQVNRIEPQEQFSTLYPTSYAYGFYIKGNTIKIMPVPPVGDPRIWYLRRPNKLVATSACGQITAVSGADITVSSLPSTFLVGTSVDLAQDQPTFNILGTREITAINSLTVTLDSAVTDLAVGDWLCLENQTPVPQIPVEFRPLLEQRVVVKVYELQGYLPKMQAAQAKLKELEKDLFDLITPRTQAAGKIIMPVNGGFMTPSSTRIYPAPRVV